MPLFEGSITRLPSMCAVLLFFISGCKILDLKTNPVDDVNSSRDIESLLILPTLLYVRVGPPCYEVEGAIKCLRYIRAIV